MKGEKYTFGDVVIMHHTDKEKHCISVGHSRTELYPLKQILTYERAGRYFVAQVGMDLPAVFELLKPDEVELITITEP